MAPRFHDLVMNQSGVVPYARLADGLTITRFRDGSTHTKWL
jgi:hypothetical protein